jgi:diguanylate cyclase (GGDEF)-like protein/PAS domain S-box-containing protein
MTIPFDEHPQAQERTPSIQDDTVALAVDAILREHPDALVCALSGDGLITALPKTIALFGQASLDGRALIDHVVAADRKTVVNAWQEMLHKGVARGDVRIMSAPERWMHLHFVDMRADHDVIVGILVPTADLCETADSGEATASAAPRFATLLEDERGAVIDCDDSFTQMFGFAPEEVIGKSVLDQVHPDDQGRAIEAWLAMLSTHRMQQYRMRRRRKDGSWMWVDSTLHNYLNRPDRNHVLVELIDVSAEMTAHEELEEREELLRRLMDAMPDGVMQVDTERNVAFHNVRLLEILGTHDAPVQPVDERSPSGAEPGAVTLGALLRTLTEQSTAAFHMTLAQVLGAGADRDVEVDVLPAPGQWRRVLLSVRALKRQSGEVSGAIATALDITDSAKARQELEQRATFDALTRCYNRTSILSALQHELAGEGRSDTAVVYVDLDHFKQVNDTLGHAVGDEALVGVVERLRHATRSHDKIGRLGGDEFLLVIRGLPEPEVALGVAERISQSFTSPLVLSGGRSLEMTVSMGVAWANDEGISAEELVKRADEAMYRSKEARRGLPVLAA